MIQISARKFVNPKFVVYIEYTGAGVQLKMSSGHARPILVTEAMSKEVGFTSLTHFLGVAITEVNKANYRAQFAETFVPNGEEIVEEVL